MTSRICASFKDNWGCDMLLVLGAVTDYCVIDEIGMQSLRQFQCSYSTSAKPFKPGLDGFEIDFGRKVLQLGETE